MKKKTKKDLSQEPKVIGTPIKFYGLPPGLVPIKDAHKYKPTFHPVDLLKRLRCGETKDEVCAAWGITFTTLQDWLDNYPGMGEALAVGRPAFLAYWRNAVKLAATGQIVSLKENTFTFVVKNSIGWNEEGQDAMADAANAELRFSYEDEDKKA